tara:strand:- start:1279 stop:2880 length:1602 start_codon:yes stop_codon:yes gene_type:complete
MVVKTEVNKAIGDMQKFSNEVKKAGDQVKKMPKTIGGPALTKGVKKSTDAMSGYSKAMGGVAKMSRAASFQVVNLFEIMAMTQGPAHGLNYLSHQLMDSFALMGPGGLAVAAAVAGMGLIVRGFRKGGDAAERFEVRVLSATAAVKGQMKEDFKDSTKLLEEFTKDLRFFGMKSREISMLMAGDTLAMMETSMMDVQGKLDQAKTQIQTAREDLKRLDAEFKNAPMGNLNIRSNELLKEKHAIRLKQQVAHGALMEGIALEKTYAKSVKESTRQIMEQRDALASAEEVNKKINELELKKNKPKKKKAASKKKDARNREMRDAWKDWNRHQKDLLKLEKDRIREAALAKKMAEQEAMRDAAFAVNFGVALMKGAADIMVEGERNMGQKLTALVLQQVGTALVAKGTLWAIEGVAGMIMGVPNGGALAAQGALAITAGVGMGAASKSLTKGLSGGNGSSYMARRDSDMSTSGGGVPSASGTLGGSSRSSGSTVINISYGVGGPNPEDAAQAVLNALHLGDRRGMTPQNGFPQGAF